MYTGTNMRKENERANGWNFSITGDGPSVVTFKVELCIHAYRRMRVYGMCKVTVINVCACVQAAVAAVNLSGGAWIEYVPWKLHDVGQRLLLADKKTEEGRTGRWGKKGGEKRQGMNGEVGATSTNYFAHIVRGILGAESLHDPRFPLCARSWRRNASFSEESHYRRGTLGPLSRTCVAKLILRLRQTIAREVWKRKIKGWIWR